MAVIADVIIIGAGVAGLSTAYNLAAKNPNLKIVLLEKEKFHGAGSTAQCTGGIRHQFAHPLNIVLSKISYPFFQRFTANMEYPVYFRKRGYLFVTSDSAKFASLLEMKTTMDRLEVPSEIVAPGEIAERYPFVQTEDLTGGSYCRLDAYADPYGVMEGYYRQCHRLGVKVICNTEVNSLIIQNGRIEGVRANGFETWAPVVVNAAGPHLHLVARLAGIDLPAAPFRRQVHVCTPMRQIPSNIPLIVDLDTGFYLHAERNGILLLGGTDRQTSPGLDPVVDRSGLFAFIEAATQRIPVLEDAEITGMYTGVRSLTPDGLGILGETEVQGFYCIGGFGGNGFMHAPAVGLIAACLILGIDPPVDPAPLSPQRFSDARQEETVVF
ncbi:sarcosine oxidase subunit beta [Desulfotomaculum arcticum]|uniref:Sarcosine oxidase subunit beta n=1 Tax=Desulfotruncus arcticus DSM 17038 TaxID=1121424 RepID=A0A1I2Z2H9_9FIRM|nr:FAD-dependent oxidoreductase [Desulfotruncus arcticus]SFH31920.1 sarcosine oxidase subunit beta [Desulfotomaculum arcticum] [Desulfotruncus arcticus DSM 17038]